MTASSASHPPRVSVVPKVATMTRPWVRTTFGPFARAAIRGVAEAFFTDPAHPPDAGAEARFGWLVRDADDFVSHGSRQLRNGLRLAIGLIELLPIFVVGRPTRASRLPLEERIRYLIKIESGALAQLGILVIAWKTLLTILYFEHPEAAPLLGYDARHERWAVADRKRPLAVVTGDGGER